MTYTPETLLLHPVEVTLRHGRLRVTLHVDLDGAEARARIAKVTTAAGEPVLDPLESDDVTELAHRAIEEAKRQQDRAAALVLGDDNWPSRATIHVGNGPLPSVSEKP